MTRHRWLAAVLVGAALAAVLSYPTIVRPGSVARADTGDGRFSVWNVAWVAHALTSDPRRVFDANIFYPHRGALAFSELNLAAGVMAAPVYAVTRNPLAAHNVVVYAALVMAFMFMWALVRRLTGSWTAALVAATAFAFAPYVSAKTAHIQLLMVWVFPLVLLAFHRFAERPGPMRAAWLGASLAAAGLACAYYGIFAGLAIGLAALWFARGQPQRGRYRAGLAVAVLTSAALVAPVMAPYMKYRAAAGGGRVFNVEEARGWSANLHKYVSSPSRVHEWAYEKLVRGVGPPQEGLFPGVGVIVFAALGLWSVARRRYVAPLVGPSVPSSDQTYVARNFSSASGTAVARNFSSASPVRVASFYAVLLLLAIWASLGPDAGLYTWLTNVVPFMTMLRAPARIGIVVVFCLAVLAGYGLAKLLSNGRRTWLTAVLVLAIAAEVAAVPWGLVEPDPVPEAYRRLAALPPGGVVEFHFPYQPTNLHQHTRYMFGSMWHWQPLVNGYSDLIPRDFLEITVPINGFPDPESFRILRARQARYVVVHLDTYGDLQKRGILLSRFPAYADYLRPIVASDETLLYEIQRWPE